MSDGLSAAVRTNLLALQKLADEAGRVQTRLATGRKINNPSDGPAAFVTASALTARAAALNSIIDGIGTGKKTLEAASAGIDAIQSLIDNARDLAYQALNSTSTLALRQSLAQQFDSLHGQIDALALDASFNGQNLLGGSDVTVTFNESGSAKVTIAGSAVTAATLGIDAASGQFQSDADIDAALSGLDAAASSLKGTAASYNVSLAVISVREDFARSMSTLLTTGASDLVMSDTNYEGAMLLALKVRQDLAATALSLAGKADQTALRLFGAG